jgi:hypothetical protein
MTDNPMTEHDVKATPAECPHPECRDLPPCPWGCAHGCREFPCAVASPHFYCWRCGKYLLGTVMGTPTIENPVKGD